MNYWHNTDEPQKHFDAWKKLVTKGSVIPLIVNAVTCKLIYVREQISDFQGEGRGKNELQKGWEKTSGDDGNVLYFDCGGTFAGTSLSKLFESYTNVCNLLYINYTSIKVIFKLELLEGYTPNP